MTTKNLNDLKVNNPKIADFITALVAAGVPTERLLVDNQYRKGTKALIVIPLGKESKTKDWFKTTFYNKQMEAKIVKLAAEVPVVA